MEPEGKPFRSQLPADAEEDEEHESKEKALQRYFLQEWKLIKGILDNIVAARRVADIADCHRIRSIMDKYQEQGQLVEPYLECIVSPLMGIVQSQSAEFGMASDEILGLIKPICIILYSLVTVCGYKSVIKFFPHQVSDLEPAVSLLEKCHGISTGTSLRQESTGEMETKCIMLLWLSILVLIPFDISSVDSSVVYGKDAGKDEPPPLVMKIVECCKDYLSTAGPMRTMAGLLLARLLTRSDMSTVFNCFIEWVCEILSSVEDKIVDHFRLLGATEALAVIFKIGTTSQLLSVIPLVWKCISTLLQSPVTSHSSLLRKYLVKLTQRIGLCCLPHGTSKWRYMSGIKTFGGDMLEGSKTVSSENINAGYFRDTYYLNKEDVDVPETVEKVIEVLLSGLRDKDTVVRWSAAKGIGRVTSRLSHSLSDDVLLSLLELFDSSEGDGSWHGGCLALAELARRGLLLPVSFPQVTPIIIKALHYDVRRGAHSVGSHVRDAAAYVCWAFARAYYFEDMKNMLEQIAPHLLSVACYDREVNCRRAAAAAFQENVGRQGRFPHGIDIVNIADYFALSSRVNSYLQVAVCIAQYDGYLHHFVDELMQNKICHWDRGLRELAATALASLVKYDPEYFANIILENLASSTLSSDLCMRHGATLAIGEVIWALYKQNYSLSPEKQRLASGVVPAIEKARLYRGKGGEIMRSAVSRFIGCISMSEVSLTEKIKRNLLDTLDENLKHPNTQIQHVTVEAYKHFLHAFILPIKKSIGEGILSRHIKQLADPNVAVRRGSALVLGVMPSKFMENEWKLLLSKICSSCLVEENPEDRDAESRMNAVKALVSVCETLSDSTESSGILSGDGHELFLFIRDEVMGCLFKTLDDYSIDNRGDVGSWVREAAMIGLERCTYILCRQHSTYEKCNESSRSKQASSFFDDGLAHKLVGSLLKQAVEKMDKLRELAAHVLRRILYNKSCFVPNISSRESLESIIPNEDDLDWVVPTVSFPRFILLLQDSSYSKYIVSGLVISIGGLQDSLRKASLSALLEYLDVSEAEGHYATSRQLNLSTEILWVLDTYKNCDRVIIPTLKTIEILFSQRLLLSNEGSTPFFFAGVLDSLATELKGARDFSKLYSGISILGYIASVAGTTNKRALSDMLTFLGHRYPKIRKSAAEQVYLVLLGNGELIPEEKIGAASEILTETCWDGDVVEARRRRGQLYELMNVVGVGTAGTQRKVQGVESKKSGAVLVEKSDENSSYSSLVDSAGF